MEPHTISCDQIRAVFSRICDKICAEYPDGFTDKDDHYQMVSEDTRRTFDSPKIIYGSLDDDIAGLKELVKGGEQFISVIELQRLAALLLAIHGNA